MIHTRVGLKKFPIVVRRELAAFLMAGAFAMAAPMAAYAAQSTSPSSELRVVITSLPPYVTKAANGHLEGIDGSLFDGAAKQLGIHYHVTVTNWDGMLAAVQSGRADIAVSDVAWTKARAKTGLFTDPSYYLVELIGERAGLNGKVNTISGLSGHNVGAINGQSYVAPLNTIPGVKLRLYPDTATLLQDLSSGRIDAAFMDPLVMAYIKEKRPDLHFSVIPIKAPTDEEIAKNSSWALFGPQMIGWYVRPGASKLVKKLNNYIHEHIWKDGLNVKAIKAAGVKDAEPFVNPGARWINIYNQQRRGVDRPKTWVAPHVTGG